MSQGFWRLVLAGALLLAIGPAPASLARADDASTDTDADGLSDLTERRRGLDPARADTDRDGLSDAAEAALGFDPAAPRTLDQVERDYLLGLMVADPFTPADIDLDAIPNALDGDLDGDGVLNRGDLEPLFRSDPRGTYVLRLAGGDGATPTRVTVSVAPEETGLGSAADLELSWPGGATLTVTPYLAVTTADVTRLARLAGEPTGSLLTSFELAPHDGERLVSLELRWLAALPDRVVATFGGDAFFLAGLRVEQASITGQRWLVADEPEPLVEAALALEASFLTQRSLTLADLTLADLPDAGAGLTLVDIAPAAETWSLELRADDSLRLGLGDALAQNDPLPLVSPILLSLAPDIDVDLDMAAPVVTSARRSLHLHAPAGASLTGTAAALATYPLGELEALDPRVTAGSFAGLGNVPTAYQPGDQAATAAVHLARLAADGPAAVTLDAPPAPEPFAATPDLSTLATALTDLEPLLPSESAGDAPTFQLGTTGLSVINGQGGAVVGTELELTVAIAETPVQAGDPPRLNAVLTLVDTTAARVTLTTRETTPAADGPHAHLLRLRFRLLEAGAPAALPVGLVGALPPRSK